MISYSNSELIIVLPHVLFDKKIISKTDKNQGQSRTCNQNRNVKKNDKMKTAKN